MSTLRVTIRLFAAARDIAGCDALDRELPAGCTVGRLKTDLAAEFPSLSTLLRHSMIAVGREYAVDDDALHDGDEIAVIPPVSGG